MSDSDEILSGTEDDDILNAIMPKAAKKITKSETPTAPPSAADSDDEVRIPTIFLTQGAKNTSLLKKANTISQHIREEHEKTVRQLEELDQLRKEFLAEINDNGSSLVYTPKMAHQMIETHIQSHYANHCSLRTHRHFFFFNDVYRVDLGGVALEKLGVIEPLGYSLDSSLYPTFSKALRARNVSKEEIALWYIENCLDERVLAEVLLFLRFYERDSGTVSTLADSLLKVSGNKASFEAPLKLVQFNNSTRLSILRAAMLFEVYSPIERETYILSFILASSDFHANKRERQLLIEALSKPTFSKIILTLDSAAAELSEILLRIQTHYYGKSPDSNKQKDYELAYNLLSNLHLAFKHDDTSTPARKVINSLLRSFLQDKIDEDPASISINQIIEILDSELPLLPTAALHLLLANSIYKYSYKAKLSVTLLTELMYSDVNKKPFLSLHIQLQSLKDRIQQDMSQWLFLSSESQYKADVSGALSEAYHALDHFSNVLNKNIPLIQKDLFYEDSQ